MKVLHILNEIAFSGAETVIAGSAKLFQERGYVLYALSTGETAGEFTIRFQEQGITVYHIPFRKSVAFFIEVGRLLRSQRFDVVHIHTERAYVWYAIVARLCGVTALVRTIHNVFHFEGLLRVRRFLSRMLCRVILGVEFRGVSDSVRKVEEDAFANPVGVIPNGIDTARFAPLPAGKTKEDSRLQFNLPGEPVVLLLSVGSCQPVKNHEAILRAVSNLKGRGQKICYVHAGSGPTLKDELRTVEELGISESVRFLGQQQEMETVYAACDIYVMPSLHEGLAVAAMEAMSCGLACVVSDVDGLRDLVDDRVNGLCVGTHSSFCEALLRLVENPDIRKQLGNEARRKAVRAFGFENYAEQYNSLYRRLVNH